MSPTDERFLAALAHVAQCEDCQKWLDEVSDDS